MAEQLLSLVPAVPELAAAYEVVSFLAASRQVFTTDDAWEQLPRVADGRVITNAFLRAAREGLIARSRIGVYRRGRQRHSRWLSIWLSLTRAGTAADAALYAEQYGS